MVQVTTGGGNNPLTKDEQINNLKELCAKLYAENTKLKDAVSNKGRCKLDRDHEFCKTWEQNNCECIGCKNYI